MILLHGTVKGSFDGRIGKKKKVKGQGSFNFLRNFKVVEEEVEYEHWFDYLDRKSSNTSVRYEQILSFEYETVLWSAINCLEREKNDMVSVGL